MARQLEMKIVYDLDDNMWEIPEFNPAHASLGQYRDGFTACIQMVDAVTVSTLALQKAVKRHVKVLRNRFTGKEIPVMIAENRVEMRMFAPPQKKKELIVGWAGSSSHIGDLEVMQDGLIEVAKENPDVVFEFRGLNASTTVAALPNARFKLWTPVSEFAARMPLWGWSIATAPLVSHDFNSSKSCIKVLEAAYCKIPCLASWVDPYAHFMSHDPELKWLLCASKSQWAPKLRDLIHDEARRLELGQRMYNVMVEHFSFNKRHEGWDKVFATVRSM